MIEPDMEKYLLTLPTPLRHIFHLIQDMYLDQENYAGGALIIPHLYEVFYEHAYEHAERNRRMRKKP